MTDTRHKLGEAEYFLEEMKKNIENDKIFSFNLSAFVTAARSVTLFMQAEFSSMEKFVKWYIPKQECMKSDCDFMLFNKMRKATVHIKRIRQNKKVSIGIVEPPIPDTESVSVKVIRAAGNVIEEHSSPQARNTSASPTEFKVQGDSSTKEVSRFFAERPDEDAIDLCEKYLQKLRNLLDEWEQNFNNS